jgi:hypothetical protein
VPNISQHPQSVTSGPLAIKLDMCSRCSLMATLQTGATQPGNTAWPVRVGQSQLDVVSVQVAVAQHTILSSSPSQEWGQ